jgi:FemAB-related protein (PEP-CTERM system-associated)
MHPGEISTTLANSPLDTIVVVATDSDEADWSVYIDRSAQATVFHHWCWRSILFTSFGHRPHFLIARRGSEVVGVLPLAEVKTLLFGHTLTSLPFCSWAGPLADDTNAEAALDQAALELGGLLAVRHIEYRLASLPQRNFPTVDLYVFFSKEISADHDANMGAIPRKQRAMVRKGIKAGLVSTIEDVDHFYPLYSDNVHRHGTPGVPMRYFKAIASAFGERCEFVIIRTPDGRALSGVLCLYWRDEVFPFYAGDTVEARNVAANDFKYWEVMRRGADRGCTRFNFGRSKRESGSFDFKKNWGFEPSPLIYEFRLLSGTEVPLNNPTNSKFRLLIEAWRRLPRPIVNAIGPWAVRGLG